jgi:putative endonuclease
LFYIYILWSVKLKKRYAGSTEFVDKRFKEHNKGNSKFTKGGIPWILIHSEEFATKTEALKREKFLKSGQGRAWIR